MHHISILWVLNVQNSIQWKGSAKAAAGAVIAAFDAKDFSEKSLLADYESGLKKQTVDEVKLDKLLMESMHDPKVMDKIVEKLARK